MPQHKAHYCQRGLHQLSTNTDPHLLCNRVSSELAAANFPSGVDTHTRSVDFHGNILTMPLTSRRRRMSDIVADNTPFYFLFELAHPFILFIAFYLNAGPWIPEAGRLLLRLSILSPLLSLQAYSL
ncbi:hypothetical protein A0H81_08239 [Grifola frondosa]|uniref:Uncharacterized protein n=1 Tax=Grifola frondosa TaxID=5627 RepID=A0A1C7M4F0_GRIFR|nr:hypothetical protein A0H81_08239 [Grifola frondosa]